MNKEVIYLEPEDDITDILTKLQQAEQKVVALVPPKKATMLRSAVNMKLVARVAKECEKVAVIVTADPAIVKMAMAARIPVAKTLQSRPIVPTAESIADAESESEQVIDEEMVENDEKPSKNRKNREQNALRGSEKAVAASEDKSAATIDLTEESLENDSKKPEKAKKKDKKSRSDADSQNFFQKYRKFILAGSVAVVALVVFGVWALIFAPAVKVTVAISSTSNNFSESVRFTTDPAAENLEEGIFLVNKRTYEQKITTNFTATSKEDRGNKATGTVRVSYSFTGGGEPFAIPVNAGSAKFVSNDGLSYHATTSGTISWDGEFPIECDNGTVSNTRTTCIKSVTVSIEADEAGEKYNSSSITWGNYQGATVVSTTPVSGGTTHMAVVVKQSDIDKIKDEELEKHKEEGKEALLEDLKSDEIAIGDSFGDEAVDVESAPGVDEEVEDGVTPSLKITASYFIYTVDRAKIEQFITQKMNLSEDQRIYSIGNPYFERYSSIDDPARLKTTVETGPTVTEADIIEKIKGRKTGQVQSILRSINGVSSVNISTSYFWVWSVPDDPSRITVELVGEEKA